MEEALDMKVVPSNGVKTSDIAATKLLSRVGGQRRRVLEYITSQAGKGATCYEIEEALSMRHSTASGRIYELHGGYDKWPYVFIENSGRTRPTDTGDPAIVWLALDTPHKVVGPKSELLRLRRENAALRLNIASMIKYTDELKAAK